MIQETPDQESKRIDDLLYVNGKLKNNSDFIDGLMKDPKLFWKLLNSREDDYGHKEFWRKFFEAANDKPTEMITLINRKNQDSGASNIFLKSLEENQYGLAYLLSSMGASLITSDINRRDYQDIINTKTLSDDEKNTIATRISKINPETLATAKHITHDQIPPEIENDQNLKLYFNTFKDYLKSNLLVYRLAAHTGIGSEMPSLSDQIGISGIPGVETVTSLLAAVVPTDAINMFNALTPHVQELMKDQHRLNNLALSSGAHEQKTPHEFAVAFTLAFREEIKKLENPDNPKGFFSGFYKTENPIQALAKEHANETLVILGELANGNFYSEYVNPDNLSPTSGPLKDPPSSSLKAPERISLPNQSLKDELKELSMKKRGQISPNALTLEVNARLPDSRSIGNARCSTFLSRIFRFIRPKNNKINPAVQTDNTQPEKADSPSPKGDSRQPEKKDQGKNPISPPSLVPLPRKQLQPLPGQQLRPLPRVGMFRLLGGNSNSKVAPSPSGSLRLPSAHQVDPSLSKPSTTPANPLGYGQFGRPVLLEVVSTTQQRAH